MKKHIVIVALLSLSIILAGCQGGFINGVTVQTTGAANNSEVSVPSLAHSAEVSETPFASGADETTQASGGLFSHDIVQNGAAVTLSLGMTFGEVTALLDGASIAYIDGNHWEDAGPGDVTSGISLTESDTCEFLDFTEDGGTLDYIQWVLAGGNISGSFDDAFPGCVRSAIETYGFLPLYYHSESGNDAVGFPLDGGYYSLFHNGSSGEVIASFSCYGLYELSEPTKDYALLLSEDVAYAASEEAADVETVLADVSAEYGETDKEGNKNTYTCEGIALYGQRLYYSIRWSTFYENEEDGSYFSYHQQIYVSLDGNTMMRGYHNKVLSD